MYLPIWYSIAASTVRWFLFFAHMRLLYEDAVHHNCVFVGRDAQGVMRHAHLRGTASRGKPFRQTVEGSDARYSFHYAGGSSSLYVFESPKVEEIEPQINDCVLGLAPPMQRLSKRESIKDVLEIIDYKAKQTDSNMR